MTTKEAKDIFISIVLSQEGISRDGNYEESIHRSVHAGKFFAEGSGKILLKFFTWSEDHIDGKLHIFINNLFIHPSIRNKNSLLYTRKLLRGLYPNAHVGYWFNKRRDTIKERI